MSITISEIKHIARLACLALEEQEITHYATELTHLLNLVEQIKEVNTDDIPALTHPIMQQAHFRVGSVTEGSDIQFQMQSLAPLVANGFYLVPKVINEE